MENYYTDAIYEILDELNVAIEGIFNEVSDQDKLEVLISKLREKSKEFASDMEHETEKIDMTEHRKSAVICPEFHPDYHTRQFI